MINPDQLVGLQFVRKDAGSNIDQCPAIHRATVGGRPGYVIQGEPLGPEALAELEHLGVEERAVWVPANVIEG